MYNHCNWPSQNRKATFIQNILTAMEVDTDFSKVFWRMMIEAASNGGDEKDSSANNNNNN